MSAPLIVKSSITIHASATKVWDVLTKPEYTEQYMFGCTIDSDWKIGGPFLWKGVFDGKEVVAVKGTLVTKEDDRLLAYTTFDPNTPMEDIPGLPGAGPGVGGGRSHGASAFPAAVAEPCLRVTRASS